MQSKDFYSTQEIEKQTCNRKISVQKEKNFWLQSKGIKPTIFIFFKETHNPQCTFKKSIYLKILVEAETLWKDLFNLGMQYPEGKPI